MDDDRLARLEELVRMALARLDRGETAYPAALCPDDPELAAELAEALGLRDRMDLLASAADHDPFAGRLLAGRYRLESCLGRGAMGVVYAGQDEELGRPVAVKLFAATLTGDAAAEQRFLREAEALAAIRDPHVVAIFDRGRSGEGLLYVVMERLEGATLAELLQASAGRGLREACAERLGPEAVARAASDRELALRLAADVAAALEAAHVSGVVHRDVKPSNVFVRRDGHAVLLDFGIAQRADTRDLTRTGATLGTPWYMAPEQARGEAATPATDVYGLGATLYHLLTGRPPFDGDPVLVVARLPIDEPPRAASLVTGLPRDVQAMLDHALAKERGRRYASAGALAADLRAHLAGLPVSVRPWPAATRVWRRFMRAPAKPLLAVAVLVLVAAGFFVVPVLQREAERERAAQQLALEATLPPLLALEAKPELRHLIPAQSRAADLAKLDQLVAIAPDDVPARMHRAALRLDSGEHAGALEDLRVVVRQQEDPYLDELARRFARADAKVVGVAAIDWSGLPEPASAVGRYAAGFDLLRRRAPQGYEERAVALLQEAAKEMPAANDLLLIALVNLGEQKQELALFTQARELAQARERELERETARTLAMRGVAFIVEKRYRDAIEVLRRADELCPDQHGPLNNLGIALQRTNQLAEAAAILERAKRVRPFFSNTYITLARVRRDQARYDDAFALADALPDDDPERLAWARPELRGTIYFSRALAHWDAEDREALAADAAQAASEFQAVFAAVPAKLRPRYAQYRDMTSMLAAGRFDDAAMLFLRQLEREPDDAYQVANLAAVLPKDGLDAAATRRLLAWVHALAARLAPADPEFAARQEARRRDLR